MRRIAPLDATKGRHTARPQRRCARALAASALSVLALLASCNPASATTRGVLRPARSTTAGDLYRLGNLQGVGSVGLVGYPRHAVTVRALRLHLRHGLVGISRTGLAVNPRVIARAAATRGGRMRHGILLRRNVAANGATPAVVITGGPADGSTTTATTATFSFGSSGAGVRFRCALDASKPRWCTSPMAYSSLSLGRHAFQVQAVNGSGAGAAATRSWTIVAPPPPTGSPPPSGSQRLYWGAHIGDQFTGGHPPWDWTALSDFENTDAGGKAVSLMPWGQYFYSTSWCGSGGYCPFVTSLFDDVRNHGLLTFFSWQTATTDGSAINTDAQIAAGAQDAYITQWAQAAKAWGHPFFMRFDWEMNGSWFPWGVGANGNTASDYVAMWRHVHDIFSSVGATNVNWVWCPNVDPTNGLASLSSLYPGDAYVDWTCLDGYNGDNPWSSFSGLFASSYNQITGTIAPSKPMIVGETASTETGGSKAQWITDMFNVLPTSFPKIHGLLWFDMSLSGPGGHTDWPLESSTSAESAFAQGIASPLYATNNYATLDTSPIPPPS